MNHPFIRTFSVLALIAVMRAAKRPGEGKGPTPKRRPLVSLSAIGARTTPIPPPIAVRVSAWPTTRDTMSAGVAPSAMRMLISSVRAVVRYAITPYTPTAERMSASAAKAPTSHAISRGRAKVSV